ncbi:uncharacterized protein EDB91DRAFT_1020198, partial [Suillus paluster]|uniref:uncharacterized protein n=1 Tax=Suillus paluster TaxID=48578 RepID=UPI001B86D61B
SERWTRRQLYLGGQTVHRQCAPNAWNGFVRQQLNNINEGLSCGDRWKLMEFMEAHKETLKHDYSRLTATQKNSLEIQVMKRRIKKQKLIHDNPKAVQRDMLASFAAMDQELLLSRGLVSFYFDLFEPTFLMLLLIDANVPTTRNQPRSLNKLISECRTHIQDELDYILREKKIADHRVKMNYTNYERAIVERYGITLEG